ncbi:MAG: DNA recombination protein RmuC [Chloroflexota bacterium]|nr:DNA recombination protein RmuC [Chloroflexota bacterium]MDE2947945.1 DNA recombination protein RmuC [Chloroflexota bacterium]
MDGFAALIANLDSFSLFVGAVIGLLAGVGMLMLTRYNMKKTFQSALDTQKESFDGVLNEMKASFSSLSSEALAKNQQDFLSLADRELGKKTEQHATDLDSKKELIDQSLESMSKSMTDTLNTVPANLEKSENRVTEVLDKSTKDLKESNQSYLNQLTEKAETQTKAHNKELDSKKELIDQRLTDMDVKLGKVERLVQELQTDRKAQFGELGERLQTLATTTDYLQKALADNRARGQWGERMADDLLRFMGMVEGVNYVKQTTLEGGSRPDFTFLLPNEKTLNMDVKFPLENYTNYFDAESDADKQRYSQLFLRDVQSRIAEIQSRGYIAAETLDCVLVFIPNEQIYRFIHEQDQGIIDSALRQKVILCSPLTLYIVLAVIRQAAQNFNIERRSREIVSVVNEIREQWGKYTELMDGMSKNFNTLQNKFNNLTGARRRALEERFNIVELMMDNNDMEGSQLNEASPQLPDDAKTSVDESPF